MSIISSKKEAIELFNKVLILKPDSIIAQRGIVALEGSLSSTTKNDDMDQKNEN